MKMMIASDIHGSAKYCRMMLEAYENEKAGKKRAAYATSYSLLITFTSTANIGSFFLPAKYEERKKARNHGKRKNHKGIT